MYEYLNVHFCPLILTEGPIYTPVEQNKNSDTHIAHTHDHHVLPVFFLIICTFLHQYYYHGAFNFC